MRSPYKDKAGSALIAFFRPGEYYDLGFSGFDFILQLAHHLASFSRSFCEYFAAESIHLLTVHWMAPSANCDMLVWW